MHHLSKDASHLVVTATGHTGFLDARTREIRLAFGVLVAREPENVRPCTPEEAAQFFRARGYIREELTRYYDSADRRGLNTGD